MNHATHAHASVLHHVGMACARHYYRYQPDATLTMHQSLADELVANWKGQPNGIASDAACAMAIRFSAAIVAIEA